MTIIEQCIKERDEALFSLDREKIEAYCRKYGIPLPTNNNDIVFWAGIYKTICNIPSAPEEVVIKAKAWLQENGMKFTIG